jgi:HD-GYP domain-containing protein (c-di-GMP phosphodiesterase class II)
MASIADIAVNSLQRMDLHEQTEKRLQQLTALRTIDLAISSSLDLRIILGILLDQVVTQLSADAAVVLLSDSRTQRLEFAAGRGFTTNLLETTHFVIGDGFVGEAMLEQKTVQAQQNGKNGKDGLADSLRSVEKMLSCTASPLMAKGEVKGVLMVCHRTPFTPHADWLSFLEALAGQAAIAIDSAQLFDNLQRSNQHLSLAYNATIEGWSRALDLRDKETEGHTQRVTEMTLRLAAQIGGFDEDDLLHIRQGSLLHDIGKMGVPDTILFKPAPLNDVEWVLMRQHPVYAYQLLLPIAYLRKALDIPYLHHERWNGTGYPLGLKNEQIPLAARIFAVVDVWDALRSDRPYRAGWPEEQVLQYIEERSGIDFDPRVVDAFLQLMQPPH